MLTYTELLNENEKLKKENQGLMELISLLRRKQYSKKSEKVPIEQLGMFNEVERESLDSEPIDDSHDVEEKIKVEGHERSRGKRLKLPDYLPRVDVVIDVEDKICAEDGAEFKCIGEEISEKLEIIPAKVQVIRTIRKKYVCSLCEQIVEASLPKEMIAKSNASASLLAYIAVAKYIDALPLYRQEIIFKRIGVELARQTMARWMIKVGNKVLPLITLLREELLSGNYAQMDETVVQVLNEDGKKADTNSYMWVQARLGPMPIILFYYAKNRSSDHPRYLLGDYSGHLQVDGYDGYSPVIISNGITRLGCWAHARRKFFDAFKSSAGKGIGKQGIIFFKKIYEVEESLEGKSLSEKFYIRLTKSIPITKNLKDWADEQWKIINPDSLGGKALKYLRNEWQYLIDCFSRGEFRIDNNFIENHIRPFTIGRKNWLFLVTPEGAMASANIYSLVETAKANGHEPFDYLKRIFEKLPYAESEQDFLELLPVKIDS